MLIPELAKQVLKDFNGVLPSDNVNRLPNSLEEGGISVINMNGIYFKHFIQLFANLNPDDAHHIPIKCAGITDNDPPAKSAPNPSKLVQGHNHALGLVDTINKSDWARLYPNKLKTFEYDLAMEADNLRVLIPIAEMMLATDGPIRKKYESYHAIDWGTATNGLKAAASYYLLNHIEKGEFAQVVASKLASEEQVLVVPDYIREAVIWACGGPPDEPSGKNGKSSS